MFCRDLRSLGFVVRKGIAAFLLLTMLVSTMGAGVAYAANDTGTIAATTTAEQNQNGGSGSAGSEGQNGSGAVAGTAEGDGGSAGSGNGSADGIGGDSGAGGDGSESSDGDGTDSSDGTAGSDEPEVTEVEAEVEVEVDTSGEGMVFYAQQTPADNVTVKLGYDHLVEYENFQTRNYSVTCNGQKILAYCIEPTVKAAGKKTFTAGKFNNALMRKVLYYSYSYPGYEKMTKAYLNSLDLKSDYTKGDGPYAFCHITLSYIYDGEVTTGDAFKGVSADTKKKVKKFVAAVKTWPDIPEEAYIGLSETSLSATWNAAEGRQETSEIQVLGTAGNSVNVPVPAGAAVVKNGVETASGSVTVAVGEKFSLIAGETVQGNYASPQIPGAFESFQPYLLKPAGKQGELFSVSTVNSVAYNVDWADFGKINLTKESADPAVTDGVDYYSLEGAEYGLYYGEGWDTAGKLVGKFVTDAEGHASISNVPYGKYYIKEIAASQGYKVDPTKHDITVASPEQSETVLEEPMVPDIYTTASESSSGQKSFYAGGVVTLTDEVNCSNLVPGKEYGVEGRLMDKETGQEIPCVTERVVFTAESGSGTVNVDFDVDSSTLGGKTVVVFEKLYCGDTLIAKHEDLNNKAQSVKVKKPKDTSPATGDDTTRPLPVALVIMTLSLIVATATLIGRNRRRVRR